MSWILIAVLAYLILAVVNLGDKFLLDKFLPSSKAYTFLVGLLGMLTFILAPWWLAWPGWSMWFFIVGVGLLFPVGLFLMFKALKDGEASQVITLVGGSIPIFTVFLATSLLGESFSGRQWLAIFLLIAGTLIISIMPEGHEFWHKLKAWFRPEARGHKIYGTTLALSAALILSIFFVGSKYAYNHHQFFSAFIWMKLGHFIAVLFLLLSYKYRREIFGNFKKFKTGKQRFVFLSNQALGGLGSILQSYAIAIGSVALVTALQGVQYVFLLILASLVTIFYPKAIKENISKHIIMQKLAAIILIALGLYLMTT